MELRLAKGNGLSLSLLSRGGRKKKPRKRRTSAPARKKRYERTYVRTVSFFLSAFLGVSRQGEFENTRGKKTPGNYFPGGAAFFLGVFFLLLFLSIFCCVG
jgi:hypothetical protein